MKLSRPEIESKKAAELEVVYSSNEFQSLPTSIDVLEISRVQGELKYNWEECLDHDSLLKHLEVSLF